MPGDYGSRYTDERVAETARTIRRVYGQAQHEIELKSKDFWRRHEVKARIYQSQVAKGEITQADYQAWLRGQVFQGKLFEQKAEQIAQTMVDADKIAQRIINGEKLDIFAANANYLSWQLEKGAGADMGFNLYDSATVSRLLRDEPDLLPAIAPEKIDEAADMEWYQKIVTNSVTQGIIQGEGIEEIFERIALNCMDRGESAAMRDARTAYTGAMNAGRVEAMRQAESLGIGVKKRWMSTFDFKTRDTHRQLDGQTVGVDEDFIVDGDRIGYPGDPTAEAALVFNCRCRLVYDHPKYPRTSNRRDDITGEAVGNMTYKQWYEWKGGAAAEKAAKGGR